jgi:hypothetical protein
LQLIQAEQAPLECFSGEQGCAFDAATIQGLRGASRFSDERFLRSRPPMAALRILKKIDRRDGCGRQETVAAPRCPRVNGGGFPSMSAHRMSDCFHQSI